MKKDIRKKTLGQLVDELSITNCKIFDIQEQIFYADTKNKGRLASKVMKLNTRRNKLIQAIDLESGYEDTTVTDKTYDD